MSTTRILLPSPFILANSTVALMGIIPSVFPVYMADMRRNYPWVSAGHTLQPADPCEAAVRLLPLCTVRIERRSMGFDNSCGDDLSQLVDQRAGPLPIQILCRLCQIQAFVQDN